MKILKKLTTIALLICVNFTPMIGQTNLPKGFKDSLKREFNKFDHCFHSNNFNDYYNLEVSIFQMRELIRKNPSLKYIPTPGTMTACGNGDFTNGIANSQWDGAYGTVVNNSQGIFDTSTMIGGIQGGIITSSASHQTWVTGGADPNVGINVLAPTGTPQAVRLGNQVNGRGFEFLEKTFTVTADFAQIRFWYAVVLQLPDMNHVNFQRPSFTVDVIDNSTSTTDSNACDLGNGSNKIIGYDTDPFLNDTNGLAYRDWSCAVIDLSDYIGKSVTIRFISRDCSKGAHYGYAYISDICGSCAGSPMGSIELSSASDCGPGRICVNLTVPRNGRISGIASAQLHIYQNGVLVQTLYSPSYLSNGSHCFDISAALLGGLDYVAGGFDFVLEGNFLLSGTWLPEQIIGIIPDGQTLDYNNDYRISCERTCCPGVNYFPPNFFENPDNNFGSDYTFNPIIALSSVLSGQYTIGNSTEATNIASTWLPNCAIYAKHLLVNGKTGDTGKAVIFEYAIPVDTGTYRFCMAAKNLPQCAFDVLPKIDVIFEGISGYDIIGLPVNVGTGFCNWQEISQTLVIPTGVNSINFKIKLDETGQGDGNDLAIDKIQLIKLEQVSQADVLASISVSAVNDNGTFNIIASPATSGWSTRGCEYTWTVMELDENYEIVAGTTVDNPAVWQTLPIPLSFNGYVGSSILSGTDPGVFDLDKRYRIIFSVACACKMANKTSWIYDPTPERNTKDEKPFFNLEIADVKTSNQYKTTAGEEDKSSYEALNNTIQLELNVYPSPATDKVNLEFSSYFSGGEAFIIDTNGKTVNHKSKLSGINTEFATTHLTTGLYLIRITNNGKYIQKYFYKN